MRLVVLGAGGLGSLLGGKLALSGVDVTLIGRAAHVEAIQSGGLILQGPDGEVVVRDNLRAVTDARQAEGDFDYLILAVKSKDNQSALQGAVGLRDRVATAFSVQNSVIKEQVLADWLGSSRRVLGASTIEAGTLVAPGRITTHPTAPVASYFGEMDGVISSRAEAINTAFNVAGLPSRAVDCISQVIWEKLVQIANAAGFSVSTLAGNPQLTFAEGMVVPEGAAHYITLAKELLAVNRAMGYRAQGFYAPASKLKEIDQSDDLDAHIQSVRALGRQMVDGGIKARTSMHVDVLAGKKTEVDFILKPFVEKAAELQVPVPTVTACYRIIKSLDYYLR